MADERPGLTAEDSVNVFTPHGQPENIPASQLQQALSVGFKVATPEDVLAYKTKQAYGKGFGNAAAAGGLGAARGLTFGLSDQFLTKSGLMAPQEIKAYMEHQAAASNIGEGAGILGGALLAPEAEGASLAADSLRAAQATGDVAKIAEAERALSIAKNTLTAGDAINPVSAASKMAGKITNAVQPGLSAAAGVVPGALPQALAKMGAAGLGAAGEGALYGAGQSITEDALGDPELNASKVMSNIGLGAVFGGALGSAFKGLELGVPAAADAASASLRKAKDAIFKPEGEVGPLGELFAKTSSFVSGKPEEEIAQALKDRQLGLVSPKENHDLATGLAKTLKEHDVNVDKLLRETNSIGRPQEISTLLEGADTAAAHQKYSFLVNEVKEAAAKMRADPEMYPAFYARKLEDLANKFEGKIGPESDAASAFKALDDLKKRVDTDIKFGREVPAADQPAQSAIREIRTSIKKSLEDEMTWGRAGARQAAFNDAQNAYFNLVGKKGIFRKSFMQPEITRSGQQVYRVSPSKIKTFLGQLGSLNGDEKAQALQRYFEVTENLINESKQTYEAFGQAPSRLGQASESLGAAKSSSGDAAIQAEHIKRMNRLGAGGHNSYLGESAAIGLGVHNPALGAAIEGFTMLRNPGIAIERLTKLEGMVKKTTAMVDKGTRAVFKASAEGANKLKGLIDQGAVVDWQEAQRRHAKLAAEIDHLANDPERMHAMLEGATKEIHGAAPKISQGIQMGAVRAVSFLASKVPKGPPALPLSEPYKPSNAEIAKFAKYAEAVDNPTNVLSQIRDGTLTPEALEAVRNVHPALYSAMSAGLMNQLAAHKGKKQPIAYSTKQSMALFLGQPLDHSMTPKALMSNQAAFLSPGKAQSPAHAGRSTLGGLSKLSGSNAMLTPMQMSSRRNGKN